MSHLNAFGESRLKNLAIAVGMLAAGAFFGAYGSMALATNVRARAWPVAKGVITEAGMQYGTQVPHFEIRY